VSADHSKGQSYGRLHRDCYKSFRVPVVLLVSYTSAVPLRPVLAQNQKPAVSYDEKKRQANDIAVMVVVFGIS
jgi:hypothetical protein